MWFRPEQLPHFVREARIESFAYRSPVSAAIRPMRTGKIGLRGAAQHLDTGLLLRRGQLRRQSGPAVRKPFAAASTHGIFSSRNASARISDTPQG